MDRRTLLITAGAAALVPTRTRAQPAASRPISIVIPFAPGGASDVVVRTLADGLAAELGRAVVVENRGGAGGLLAAGLVARAPADGQVLLYGNQGQMLVARHLLPGSGVQPLEVLSPIVLTATTSFFLVVPAGSPVASATGLAAAGHAAPLRFGIPGVGTPPHLATALWGEATGSPPELVPYQGSGPLLVDLIAGRLDAAFDNVASSLPHLRSGKLRALGVSSPRRSPVAEQIPTLAEAGIVAYAYRAWQGLFAPVGTPADVKAALGEAVQRSLAAPAVRKRLEDSGLDIAPLAGDPFQALIERDDAFWQGQIRKGSLKVA